jgi:hypothetical protein
MYQNNELEPTLRLAINSLLRDRSGAFTVGVLETELYSILNSNGVTDEVKTQMVSRIVRFAFECSKSTVGAGG